MRTVSGLDVHKDSIYMCILDKTGKKTQEKFGVTTREIKRMGSVMQSYYVSDVCMESTSIYWMPIWRLLENDFHLHLVNPLFLKQLPGRKSDVKDAEWIATALIKDLIKDSFVPNGTIQQLRQYGRRINEINKDIVRCEQHIDTILQRCNIRLSNHVSRTRNKSYRKVVDMLINGETSADVLLTLIHGRTVNKYGKTAVHDSLEGCVSQSDRDLLSQYTQMLDMYEAQKQQCTNAMVQICLEQYKKAFLFLLSIPGIKEPSAAIIISEIGDNMNFFATAAALVSWAGLRPRNDESAGKIKSRKIIHGNKYLRKILMECAWGAARTKNSVFYCRFWHLKGMKKHHNAVIVAIARQLLTIVWTLLTKQEQFDKQYHLKKNTI
ncbi:MAG: IS110 family transposase [Paludibacter sp.]|jgi:transposase|nr:IS110 family transposase [Paludibacter sp.]